MKAVTYTYRISTSAKPETSFAYISDLTHHPEWNDHLHVTALTPGEIKIGSEYHSVGKTLYEDRHNDIRVTAYQPSTIFSFVAHDPDFKHNQRLSCFNQDGSPLPLGEGLGVRSVVVFLLRWFYNFLQQKFILLNMILHSVTVAGVSLCPHV